AGMALNIQQRVARIGVRLDELSYWRERESVPVTGWTANGAPIAEGAGWPTREGVVSFAGKVEGAGNWPLAEPPPFVDLGGEGLVTLDYGDDSAGFGNDPYHKEYPVKALAFALTAEATARRPFGEPVRNPVLVGGRLSWIDMAVHQLHLRLKQ